MDKTKVLTQEDIDLLFSEDWLTVNQQQFNNFYVNQSVSYSQIEKICPDASVLNFIFNPKPLEIEDIIYEVNLYQYGETNSPGFTFKEIKEAIECREKLLKQNPNSIYEISVTYKIKGK